jgi:hypothetical protein
VPALEPAPARRLCVAIQDEAQSKVPVLGYTVPYALGNILLTAWGPVIVLLTRRRFPCSAIHAFPDADTARRRRGAAFDYSAQRRRQTGPLPNVVVLATGGTIAGAAASDVQAGYTSGQVGVEQLLPPCRRRRSSPTCAGEQISNIGSQDMNDEVWIKLATRINELVAMPDVAGVVITHGTDTIEETAYFLNLVSSRGKPGGADRGDASVNRVCPRTARSTSTMRWR